MSNYTTLSTGAASQRSHIKPNLAQAQIALQSQTDITPPYVIVEFPDNGISTKESTIDIRGLVIDEESGIQSLTINGKQQNFSTKGIFEKKNNSLIDGLNQFEIKATNKASLSTIEILKIYKEPPTPPPDTTPPTITVLQPKNNAIVDTAKILVSGQIKDESGIDAVFVNNFEVVLASDGRFAIDVNLVFGLNTIHINAFDKNFNEAKEIISVSYQKKENLVIILSIGNIKAYVAGVEKQVDPPPYIRNGSTLVPLRFIGESFGARIDWLPNLGNGTISILLDGNNISLELRNTIAIVNGKNVKLLTPPEITKGRTFVPLRFIAEAFGADVNWESKTQIITITLIR